MGGIERGEHNLTIQTALTIAKGLGISLSKLFSGIEEEVSAPISPTAAGERKPG